MRKSLLFFALCTVSLFSFGQTKPAPAKPAPSLAANKITAAPKAASDRLPVKRIVLYKNGVGYFEHTGQVQGNQQVSIDFTTSQLDDAIKSLTVLDLGKGRISSIRYNSIAPLEERLRTLRLPLGENTTQMEFLRALRGSRIDVRSGTTGAVGRLLSVETKTRTKAEQSEDFTQLSLITDSGELRNFELTPALNIRIVEADLHEEVGKYLSLIASTRERDIRRMTIAAEGTGDRQLFVSYISEVPVWKSTYRIVLPTKSDAKPLLQGWAIVDNTVGEDWKDVDLSLVAGAPQSFVQHISQPLYSHRPVVALPETAQLAPQAHESSMNAPQPVRAMAPGVVGSGYGRAMGGIVGMKSGVGAGSFGKLYSYDLPTGTSRLTGVVRDPQGAVISNTTVTVLNAQGGGRTTQTDSNGNYFFSNLPPGNYRLQANSPGFKTTAVRNIQIMPYEGKQFDLSMGVASASETVEVSADSSTSELLENVESDADTQSLGDLFEYKLKQKVTIGKNQSALVPIVQTHIDAEQVSLWNEDRGRALRALWVNNTSGITFDAGTFNVLENDTFAGEGLLAIIRPNEKRLLSYAVDQSVKVVSKHESVEEKVTRVRISHGMMVRTYGSRDSLTYTVSNNNTDTRTVVIEHPVNEGWKITSPVKPDETTSTLYRFRIKVEPMKSATLLVEEFKPQDAVFDLNNLNDDTIALFIRQKAITPDLEAALRKIIAQKITLSGIDNQIRQRQKEMNDISTDQNRLRENMKALKGSAEEKALLQRYATQLNQQEDRLDALRKELVTLQSQSDDARHKLMDLIGSMELDITI